MDSVRDGFSKDLPETMQDEMLSSIISPRTQQIELLTKRFGGTQARHSNCFVRIKL